MQKYEAIENGIANGDVKALREALGSLCYTSRDFSSGEFDEAVKYVESKGINIMDATLEGAPTISSQKSSFTDDDFAKAIFELKKNFCRERIEDVKTIGKALYKSQPDDTTFKSGPQTNDNNGQSPNESSHQRSKLPIGLGLVAVLAIIVIVLLLARK